MKFTKSIFYCCATASLLLFAGLNSLQAQQQSAPQSIQPQATVNSAQADTTSGVTRVVDQYRIGPRDVLTIRVTAGRLVPELSMDAVEVDECGRIPVLSVEQEEQNEIQAAGKTRTELVEQLRLFYKKYKKNPDLRSVPAEAFSLLAWLTSTLALQLRTLPTR